MRFLIAGASGFLGTKLTERLRAHDHEVVKLVRREPTASDERRWSPYDAPLGPEVVADVDVVVNLAGAPTLGNPHLSKWQRELEESRVTTTRVISEAIAAADSKPVFLAGNGISYYGDHGAEVLDESGSSKGTALLTRVTRVWQQATTPAAEAGARVVVLRTAPVLDQRSAPLSLLKPLFKLGLGGVLGSGKQYFPCITLTDWIGAVEHCATHEVSGPVNLTIPEPATNAQFTRALASALHRPAVLPVPAFVLKPAAGAMAPELLGSVRAVPQALLDSGYAFAHPSIGSAVDAALSSD